MHRLFTILATLPLIAATGQATGRPANPQIGGDGTNVTVTATGSGTTKKLGDRFIGPGRTLYVKSDTGNDSQDCWSWGTACKTLLGAFDKFDNNGGTIYFANGAWVGGEVANQGLWFIGTNDANWGQATWPGPGVPVARGWRAQKPVRFIGADGTPQAQLGLPSVASIVGGQGQGWAADRSKPGIWLAGTFSPMVFENMAVIGATRCALIGVGSDGSDVANSLVATQWFRNVSFQTRASYSTDDGITGPTVEIGYAFWIYFQDSNLLAYTTADATLPIGDDRHAAVLIHTSGLQYFNHGRWAQGGVKSYTIGQEMNDIIVESSGGGLPPVFWGLNYTVGAGGSYATLINLARSDNTTSTYPDVLITSTATAGAVSTTGVTLGNGLLMSLGSGMGITHDGINIQGISSAMGPALVAARQTPPVQVFPFMNPNAPSAGQTGFFGGRVWGRHESVRRNFGPVYAPATNIAYTSSGSFGLPGGATLTQIAGPDGQLNAWKLTTSVYASVQSITLSAGRAGTISVGDRFYLGAWVRLPTVTSHTFLFGSAPGTLRGAIGDSGRVDNQSVNLYDATPLNAGDGNWQWVWRAATVTTGTTNTYQPALFFGSNTGNSSDNLEVDFAYPVDMYIPAGTVSDNEWGEIVEALAAYPPGAPVGSRAMWGPLYLAPGATGYVQIGGVAQASLGTPPNGTFIYCTDCTIASPCAGGGNGALAKRLNGAWICN